MDEHAISKTQPASTVDSTAIDSQRVYPGSPLIEAPSIGPKTAKRFEKVGIRTIDQFTSRNPDDLESLLATDGLRLWSPIGRIRRDSFARFLS